MLSKEANDFEPIFSAAVTAPSGKDGPVEGKRRMIVDCAMEVEKARLIRRPPSSSIWTLACTPNKKIQKIANTKKNTDQCFLPFGPCKLRKKKRDMRCHEFMVEP